jgi:hypothetical protein
MRHLLSVSATILMLVIAACTPSPGPQGAQGPQGEAVVGNSRSDILVVQSAQNRHGQRLTDGLDGTGNGRVLLQ